ncbi:MAG: XrtA/PEP-CTERM system-associated ATPase [Pseudomonadota bacterium]
MYEEFFSFNGSPFRLAPDPKFFFGSKSHNKAMAYLHYGLRQAEGFIVITGEIGAGKSMLIGRLLDQLDRSNVLAANLVSPNLAPEDLLSHILSAFRIEPSGAGKAAEIEAFEDFLFDQMNHGRRVLLVVDEAQNLPLKTLEELRVLSNLEYDGTPLFQVFLVGQPDFRETMARPDMEQLRQRVIATYHIDPMSREDTEKYIGHRLACVGWGGDPKISKDAYDAIYAATGGVPRKVHKLCNRALLHLAVEKLHAADGAVIAAVLADMAAEQSAAAPADREAAEEEFDLAAAMKGAARASEAPSVVARTVEPIRVEPARVDLHAATETAAKEIEAGIAAMALAREESAPVGAAGASASAASVFDRLRAGRSSAKAQTRASEDAEDVRPPKSATLDDVANAIAAARPTRNMGEVPIDAPVGELFTGAVAPPPPVDETEGWKRSVVHSINDTREELKRAHDSVAQLRRQLTDIDRRRRKRRIEIAASLDRAESLLAEFQNAWR